MRKNRRGKNFIFINERINKKHSQVCNNLTKAAEFLLASLKSSWKNYAQANYTLYVHYLST